MIRFKEKKIRAWVWQKENTYPLLMGVHTSAASEELSSVKFPEIARNRST